MIKKSRARLFETQTLNFLLQKSPTRLSATIRNVKNPLKSASSFILAFSNLCFKFYWNSTFPHFRCSATQPSCPLLRWSPWWFPFSTRLISPQKPPNSDSQWLNLPLPMESGLQIDPLLLWRLLFSSKLLLSSPFPPKIAFFTGKFKHFFFLDFNSKIVATAASTSAQAFSTPIPVGKSSNRQKERSSAARTSPISPEKSSSNEWNKWKESWTTPFCQKTAPIVCTLMVFQKILRKSNLPRSSKLLALFALLKVISKAKLGRF